MSEENARMNVSVEEDVSIVELTDRKILDEISIMQIGDQINALVSDVDQPKLIIDFSQVGHMSSSALGMLITLQKRVRDKKGQLRLCNIQPSIYEIFVITRLNEIFQISQSKPDAIASMN